MLIILNDFFHLIALKVYWLNPQNCSVMYNTVSLRFSFEADSHKFPKNSSWSFGQPACDGMKRGDSVQDKSQLK